MTAALIVCLVTCATMIAGVLWLPSISVGRYRISTYWLITLCGALVLLCGGFVGWHDVAESLTAPTAINPLKILTLFLSMTALSVYLDEAGIFRSLAVYTVNRSQGGQWSLLWHLYVTVSVLTVFTSNDVIILTFTPFICYFARSAGINPVPYLFAEFAAANTWSMALIIGNPTNIYLATSAGIGFTEYLRVMLLPTAAGGVTGFIALYLLFRRQLSRPLIPVRTTPSVLNRPTALIGLLHFSACLILLVASSWTGLEMWSVSLAVFTSLVIFTLLYGLFAGRGKSELRGTLRRVPWQLIPFVLSMFTIVLALDECGFAHGMARWLGTAHPTITYGVASFLASNIINNIPMSVLFSTLITDGLSGTTALQATYATIVGSNVGALLSPVGALAGLMWSAILRSHDVEISYVGFVWRGMLIGVPSLFATLAILNLTI